MDQMILRWNPTIFFSFKGEDVGLIGDSKAVSNSDQKRVGGVSEVKVTVMFDEFQRGLCCQSVWNEEKSFSCSTQSTFVSWCKTFHESQLLLTF